MAKLTGLASIVAELRAQRTKLVNELRHVDAALAVLGKLDGGSSYTVPGERCRHQPVGRSVSPRKLVGHGTL